MRAMKKLLVIALLAGALMLAPGSASAHEYDRDDTDYPLRIVAYVLHPIGMAVEYAVLRPIHYLVSMPTSSIVFGHDVTESEDYDYFTWH